MTLAISDTFLSVSPIRQRKADVGQVPILIFLFLQDLDPHVRDSHGQTIIEPHASQGQGHAQSWHARHVLGNSDALGVELVEHLVGKHEIYHRLLVDIRAEIFVISAREPTLERRVSRARVESDMPEL